jgi:hypothetical protein
MEKPAASAPKNLSRRFCVAPMMESKNADQKTLLFGIA